MAVGRLARYKLFIVVFAALAVFALLVYRSLAGSFESGTVKSWRELPVLGSHVQILDPNGPIEYIRHRMYVRPTSAILVAGDCPIEHFKGFFAQHVRSFQEHDRRVWTHLIEAMRADPCHFSVGQPGRDLTGYREVQTPKQKLVIRGVFRAERSSFILYVVEVRHGEEEAS